MNWSRWAALSAPSTFRLAKWQGWSGAQVKLDWTGPTVTDWEREADRCNTQPQWAAAHSPGPVSLSWLYLFKRGLGLFKNMEILRCIGPNSLQAPHQEKSRSSGWPIRLCPSEFCLELEAAQNLTEANRSNVCMLRVNERDVHIVMMMKILFIGKH